MVEGIDTTGVQGPASHSTTGRSMRCRCIHGRTQCRVAKARRADAVHHQSGGNQYRGTLYADYENRAWQSFNIDEDQIARGAQGGAGLSPGDANRLWSYHDINADVGGYLKKERSGGIPRSEIRTWRRGR